MIYYEFVFLRIEGSDSPVISKEVFEADCIDEAIAELRFSYPNLYKIIKCYEIVKQRII